ncbi:MULTISPECIES: trypsin-like serine protease [unclassified Bacillus (in: firmicutes)]|uniref:S1 family peptidase n=1 Tax=unclassified Bacillus (in: firmicutes) TaxID=185979 RepID=UPI0008F0A5D1|nr:MULTISPECIES: trypsin-like serine protease [unclassified Bacillus (in: firmicutes)]SFB20375.1 Trypsin [Bacillus sp. UNCCL13]SFQ90865.1 Trypsin [Bacillus sp. cl95]
MKKKSKKIVALLATLGLGFTLFGQSTSAITYGNPDGGKHKNVGALIIEEDGEKRHICTGTLISEDVFLTASHCTEFLPEENEVWVSFDENVEDAANATLHSGKAVTNPAYTQRQNDTGDIAVVLLEHPIKDIKPATLPTAGLFDQLAAKGKLKDQKFTAVGYGVKEPVNQPGGADFPYDGNRNVSVSEYNALNETWLRLNQNAAAGNSGTCFGDSGGPNFFGSGENETNMIAGITVTGDMMCIATNATYRLDTPSARNFLDKYVDLP